MIYFKLYRNLTKVWFGLALIFVVGANLALHEFNVIAYNTEFMSWSNKGRVAIAVAYDDLMDELYSGEIAKLDARLKAGLIYPAEYTKALKDLDAEFSIGSNQSQYEKIQHLMQAKLPENWLVGNDGIFYNIVEQQK